MATETLSRTIIQSRARPTEVLFAFDEVVDASVSGLRWAVSFMTRTGCERLVDRLSRLMGSNRWNRASKEIVTAFDYGITEPEAITYLANDVGAQVLIADTGAFANRRLRPNAAFHAKTYMFREAAATRLIVGSANLTLRALTYNTEVVTACKYGAASLWDFVWQEATQGAQPLTAEILAEYARRRRAVPAPPEPDEPPPAAIASGAIPVFWDALQSGAFSPMSFDYMWVEAGSMSSGGSHNQLELPRGANRFFGFRFSDYGHAHETIGYPRLTAGTQAWSDRPLTWHGNNGMERINLPTRRQSGFEYPGTAILFRRRGREFELAVAAWDDSAAVSWRNASVAAGLVFKLGGASNRTCGLF